MIKLQNGPEIRTWNTMETPKRKYIIALTFGNKFEIFIDKIISLDCPNQNQGISCIELTSLEPNIWTGDIHFTTYHPLRIHFSQLTKIETRTNLYETDEEWKTIWHNPNHRKNFKYETYYEAATILKKLYNESR
jgi:hypothetical protein